MSLPKNPKIGLFFAVFSSINTAISPIFTTAGITYFGTSVSFTISCTSVTVFVLPLFLRERHNLTISYRSHFIFVVINLIAIYMIFEVLISGGPIYLATFGRLYSVFAILAGYFFLDRNLSFHEILFSIAMSISVSFYFLGIEIVDAHPALYCVLYTLCFALGNTFAKYNGL